jgi:hypothetical protein
LRPDPTRLDHSPLKAVTEASLTMLAPAFIWGTQNLAMAIIWTMLLWKVDLTLSS